MGELTLSAIPVASAAMLFRRPVTEVFEAFVDPAITTRFWFKQGSGRLEPERSVEWTWDMYGFTIPVTVKSLVPNQRIVIEWPSEGGATTVEWLFTSREDGSTFVEIKNWGFAGTGDAVVEQALDSTGGFALVLAGAKAWLEHGIRLNLVLDRFPKDDELSKVRQGKTEDI